jgi:DNA-binding transcriptional LysR family regulator
MPLHLVQPDLDSGALVRIHADGTPRRLVMPMRIAFRKDAPPGPAARSFMAQLAG